MNKQRNINHKGCQTKKISQRQRVKSAVCVRTHIRTRKHEGRQLPKDVVNTALKSQERKYQQITASLRFGAHLPIS